MLAADSTEPRTTFTGLNNKMLFKCHYPVTLFCSFQFSFISSGHLQHTRAHSFNLYSCNQIKDIPQPFISSLWDEALGAENNKEPRYIILHKLWCCLGGRLLLFRACFLETPASSYAALSASLQGKAARFSIF